MEIIIKPTMKILIADIGYMLHDTVNNTYCKQIYAPVDASLDHYEEVVDETVSESIRLGFKAVKEKEQSIRKIGKLVANTVTDDVQALDIKEFYDDWQVGVQYNVGKYVLYNGVLYKVISAHTSQADWSPPAAASLFANVLTSLDGTPKEWVQPDSTNPYMKGDKVIFEGKTYESTIDNNVWSPKAYPSGWKEI